MLGKPVTVQLAAADFEVTALVRNPEKAATRLPASVKRVQANLRNIQSLKRRLAGQDALYLSLSVEQTEKGADFYPNGRAYATPCRRPGERRPAYLLPLLHCSTLPDGLVVFALKRRAVEDVRAASIPYTIFYPT